MQCPKLHHIPAASVQADRLSVLGEPRRRVKRVRQKMEQLPLVTSSCLSRVARSYSKNLSNLRAKIVVPSNVGAALSTGYMSIRRQQTTRTQTYPTWSRKIFGDVGYVPPLHSFHIALQEQTRNGPTSRCKPSSPSDLSAIRPKVFVLYLSRSFVFYPCNTYDVRHFPRLRIQGFVSLSKNHWFQEPSLSPSDRMVGYQSSAAWVYPTGNPRVLLGSRAFCLLLTSSARHEDTRSWFPDALHPRCGPLHFFVVSVSPSLGDENCDKPEAPAEGTETLSSDTDDVDDVA
ncbi:hypothetical protein BV25DRAFT_1841997 [Artomyces pyxidatus]|uniref:Uncharacterized protein n=1 Tax=Artomyces pyxidatus TaxID=48021 RepID=A0ACB8SME2_9AGAM|nr:hypothetical protein BV25DRAFT_1841997 [Artomyces pyxidatus]